MRRPKAATSDDAIVAALQDAMKSAAEPELSQGERRGGALAQALRSLRPSAALTAEEATAAVRRTDPTRDPAWAALASRWPGLAFYAFDLETRSFVATPEGGMRGRGLLLVTVPAAMYGRPAPFSLALPVALVVAPQPGGGLAVVWQPSADAIA